LIVVRESNGILRKADHPEREKMLQVYFPKEGKSNYVPKMFEALNLEVNKIPIIS
jgi:small subunit ribosomal protein S22